jgi:hypothetical protein
MYRELDPRRGARLARSGANTSVGADTLARRALYSL